MASVRKRVSSGGVESYAVLYRDGSQQRSRTFVRQREADKFATLLNQFGVDEALRLINANASQRAPAKTLDAVAREWLAHRVHDVADGKLTPRVLTAYTRDYEKWIKPYLGDMDATKITEIDIQEWVEKMRRTQKLNAKSIGDRHAVLHGIYKWATNPRRRERLNCSNPCIGTELPEKTKTAPKGLRLPELAALNEAARKIHPDAADLISFICGTGWRLGEAIALTAGQVEDDGHAVYVTMTRVWRREVGFTDGAKSDAGLRRLRVLGDAVSVLRRRIVGLAPTDLVFTTVMDNPWQESYFRVGPWKRIVAEAGLAERKPTPHWLRHSHVFICHAAGMDLAEIQRRIGHKNIAMTMDTYGRLIEGMNDDVAERLETLLTMSVAPKVIEGAVVRGELG